MAEPSAYSRGGDDDDEDEEEAGDVGYKTVKDAVLFAIDVSESMLTKPGEGDPKKPDTMLSPTVAALKCAYALMQQRIISNPNDMMGILLFGTEKSEFQEGDGVTGRGGLQYPHCYLLTDLDVPAAADVKQLRSLVEDEDEAADLLVASREEVSMANVLFCANQIFTTKAPNFSSRRLFLVSDNDYPHASNRDARNSAAVRAKDLYDLGVTIELFPISHPDRDYTFDRNKFYNDIVYSSTPSDPDAPQPLTTDIKAASSTAKDGISLLQSLLSSVASRSAPRRAQASHLPFEIGPGLKISVKSYILTKRQTPKRTSYIYVPPDSEKAQIVSYVGQLIADDTARTVEKTEVRRAYKFGGETISFSEEELAKIKNFGDPILRIIGF
ncbi:ATP-dependent DNA helicase II subunit 1, partial [Teratosphaeriaceae sp. CCFEE 6253]